MGNPFGRATIVPLTNKSGGAVAAGDLVYIDTANNDSFTTGTTSGYTKGVGIAQATIASNAIGLVLIAGYASLVNVNASVTRGNFLKGHSVVKQGTDAGSSRAAGTFGMFLTGGTTPDAVIWQPDLGAGSGEVVSTAAIWDAAGDLAQGTGPDTAAKLSAGTAGQFLMAQGSSTALAWKSRELDYVEKTSNTSITATVESSADTIVTGSAVAYDGSTAIDIEFYAPACSTPSDAANRSLVIDLYDNGSSIGFFGQWTNEVSGQSVRTPAHLSRRLTPSNASHTYSIRAHVTGGTGTISGGAGGAAAYQPAFIRITRAV